MHGGQWQGILEPGSSARSNQPLQERDRQGITASREQRLALCWPWVHLFKTPSGTKIFSSHFQVISSTFSRDWNTWLTHDVQWNSCTGKEKNVGSPRHENTHELLKKIFKKFSMYHLSRVFNNRYLGFLFIVKENIEANMKNRYLILNVWFLPVF